MILLQLDERAQTVAIEDAGGELINYRAAVLEGGALALHNLDNDNTYTITPAPRLWRCSCPDWHYRGSKGRRRGCKHSQAAALLYRFVCDFRALIAPLEIKLMPDSNPEIQEFVNRLSARFDPREVKFKPAVVNGNRALALAYVDARTIQDRLDLVLGLENWQDEYEFLPDGSAVCRLRLRLGDEWITKMDVGGPSEQSDEGDRRKAAVSDALKRAAVKFGIGRYLYRLPSQWVAYDSQKRRFASTPTLPPEALPSRLPPQLSSRAPAERGPANAPTDGIELEQRLGIWEQRAVQGGYCQPGELFTYMRAWGQCEANQGQTPIERWPASVVTAAWQEFERWRAERKAQKKPA